MIQGRWPGPRNESIFMKPLCHNPPLEAPAETWSKAWLFAAERHQGQGYPSTDLPYLVHLGAVVLELIPALPGLEAGLAVSCAILHDTLEDTETSPEDLNAHFGPSVRDGVMALTKNPALKGLAAMRDSLDRIKRQPKEIWAVKLADRAANLGPKPRHWSLEKVSAYAREGELIHQELSAASPILARRLLDRIDRWKTASDLDGLTGL